MSAKTSAKTTSGVVSGPSGNRSPRFLRKVNGGFRLATKRLPRSLWVAGIESATFRAGLPFTAADVVEDLRLRVVEMSMVFEIPSLAPMTRMWVVSRESEPVGLPARTLVTLPSGRLSARFDAAAFAKFPLVPLDFVVKNGSQVRRCTIPVAAVRNVLGA